MDDNLLKFMDYLEVIDTGYLNWGLVDYSYSEDEIKELIEDCFNYHIDDLDGFINQLTTQNLLYSFYDDNSKRYRTRLSETVRLISHLKQLFPNRDWRSASNLVADFRFLRRPRKFPRRDKPLSEIFKQFKNLSNLQKTFIETVMGEKKASQFQLNAFQSISDHNKHAGVVIGANTGSGKTLAFYLPVLVRIIGQKELEKGFPSHQTKCISLYPRTELLRDQISEVIRLTKIANGILLKNNLKPISSAALFSGTPLNTTPVNLQQKFQSSRNGYIIPFVYCNECESDLEWVNGENHLRCTKCKNIVLIENDGELYLTRNTITSSPPDLLFTTTEMLNRHMASSDYQNVFALTRGQELEFFLLDEVHTYEGAHGAHVAGLIRRWKKLSGSIPCFVGLSATLLESSRFFGEICGLNSEDVVEITPSSTEYEENGVEYNLVLRSDPTARTTLLSTTIQLAMLLRRVMDKSNSGIFGEKVFLFTDDLDVTNRLYRYLNDAEGRTFKGRIRPDGRKSYAQLRNPDVIPPTLHRAMNAEGQLWTLPKNLGFMKVQDERLIISRTTSQDTGINKNSDIISATASLELGYNDPTVGAVIQHKTPRGIAQFIQRKGRAGRRVDMRPWTVVTLSDFGIDRVTYQMYEGLFYPELQPIHLPLNNIFILKIQAVYTLMEWVLTKLQIQGRGYISMWSLFSEPKNGIDYIIGSIINLLERLLKDNETIKDFEQHLRDSLKIDSTICQTLLWEPPRSIIKIVVPTILRRLKTNWRNEGYQKSQPLPEFMTQNLFSDLNFPEISFKLGPDKVENMPLYQGLKEFSPGRVSARFMVEKSEDRYWFPIIPNQNSLLITNSETSILYDPISMIQDGERLYQLVRPLQITLVKTAGVVKDTSNSFPKWRTKIEYTIEQPFSLEIPSYLKDNLIISDIRVFSHQDFHPLLVTRMMIGADVVYISNDGSRNEFEIDFEDDKGGKIAFGCENYVDGIGFNFAYPEKIIDPSDTNYINKLLKIRTDYFKENLENDPLLKERLNKFDREKFHDLVILTILELALGGDHNSLDELLEDGNFNIEALRNTYNRHINHFSQINEDEHIIDGSNLQITDLTGAIDEQMVTVVCSYFSFLKTENPGKEWLRKRYKSTLAAAILSTIQTLVPTVHERDIVVDIDTIGNETSGRETIWISELSPGGSGIVDKIVSEYQADPHTFFQILESKLSGGILEDSEQSLSWFLGKVTESPIDIDLESILNSYRDSDQVATKHENLIRIREYFSSNAVKFDHTISHLLISRILFNGSQQGSDKLISSVRSHWRELESKLGFEIEPRLVGRVFSESYRDILDKTIPGFTDQSDAYGIMLNFLWMKDGHLRERELSIYNPFFVMPKCDRLMLTDKISIEPDNVFELSFDPGVGDLDSHSKVEQIFDQISTRLSQRSILKIKCVISQKKELSSFLRFLMVQPLDINGLQIYPHINKITEDTNHIYIDLTQKTF